MENAPDARPLQASVPDAPAFGVPPSDPVGRDAAGRDAAGLLRRLLIVLATLAVVGTAIDLAMVRHWTSPSQWIAWVALGVAAGGAAALARRPSRGTILAVRGFAVAVLLSAAVGVFVHVDSNHEAGPLDYRYMDTWDDMSAASRWWAAATMTVGPAPPVAPVALAHAALCLLFATARHPVLASKRVTPDRLVPNAEALTPQTPQHGP